MRPAGGEAFDEMIGRHVETVAGVCGCTKQRVPYGQATCDGGSNGA